VWPPIRFDRPLGVGAQGGHGFVRYSVGAYEPGRRIRFDFPLPQGGFHALETEPLDGGRCLVRHVLEQRQGLGAALLWATAIRPLHEAMVGDLLDNIVRAATPDRPPRPARWTRRTRLLHRAVRDRAKAVPPPRAAELARRAFERPDFIDACRIPLHPGMPLAPHAWRTVLPFPVTASAEREILLGQDAGHLDFRASLLVEGDAVTLTTVVRVHNRRGRAYWTAVRPFHPLMARLMLTRAHRRLTRRAAPAPVRVAG
jgi:hypothetical protein